MVVCLPAVRYRINKGLRAIWFLTGTIILLLLQAMSNKGYAQMRQVYIDNTANNNEIVKLSFYTPSEGYVAFMDWVGFTTDSGRTFTKKYIAGNVNYNGYNVNLTFGFGISGVKAFNRDTLLVYGDYGFVPSILYSTDQGNTFTLIYQSQFNAQQLTNGITDMVFPGNTNIGYATEADRIIKTVDRGKSWFATLNSVNSFFDFIEPVDDNTVFAFSTQYANKLVKTTNGGVTWQQLVIPAGQIHYASFISANKGWANVGGGEYYTSNGGTTWEQKNNSGAVPFSTSKMKFINDSVGYAKEGLFTLYKTTDSGKIWEPLPRDNSYTYLGYDHNDIQFWNNNQFWAGGGHGFLELTTNGGGIPLPKAYFIIDTTGLSVTGKVNLVNYSKPNHQYLWYKNDTLIGTTYNISYTHNVHNSGDTITLIATDGIHSDTALRLQYFYVPPPPPPPPAISSFTPTSAATGATVTITGTDFTGTTAVAFGGIPAASFNVVSTTIITAVVTAGASGKVTVTNAYGTAEINGFTFIPPPVIKSFTPAAAPAGTTITIYGSHFTGASAVSFGGIATASFTVVSDTSITAVTANGGSGSIIVTTPGGVATINGFTFYYAPVITDFSPIGGNAGTVVFIKGMYFTGTTAVSFGGVPAASFTVNSDTTITAVVASGASGAITVTSAYGTGRSADDFDYRNPPSITSFSPAIGGNGTTVVITGTNFYFVTSVTFGGVPAQAFTIYSDKKLLAAVGPGATGDVTVSSPYGSATAPGFKFYEAPAISSISPTSGTAGTEVTITGTNFDTVFNVKFGGVLASSFKKLSNTVIKAIIGDGNSGPVSVTTPGGTASNGNFTFIQSAAPTIISVTPAAAPAGTVVTITGTNFKQDVNGNTVYFGAVKAVVVSATTISLQALVPPGATYGNITVTSNNLTASSEGQFSITPPALNDITPDTYKEVPDSMIANAQASGNVFIKDIDGDGKPDIVRGTAKGVVILRNTTSNGNTSFLEKINYSFLNFCNTTAIGDLDGDGRPDIAVGQHIVDSIIILRNNSTAGNISFDTTTRLAMFASNLSSLNICDLDNDGKPDIYTVNSGVDVNLFKNTTRGSSISFVKKPRYRYLPANSSTPAPCDLNGDGKPELVLEYNRYNGTPAALIFLKNISTTDTMAFAPLKDTISGDYHNSWSLGDLDGDGKTDVVITTDAGLSVLRNTSIDTNFSFQKIDIPVNNGYNQGPSVADIDGDGKPDIVVTKFQTDSICIFKNISVPGNISFIQKANYPSGYWLYNSIVCDLNGDQLPEITEVRPIGTTTAIAVLQRTGSSGSNAVQFCSTNGISFAATTSGAVYQWQMDNGSGFNNINDNNNFSGTHTAVLKLSNVPAAWTGYQFRCLADATPGIPFKIVVTDASTPNVIISGNNAVNSGQTVTISASVTNGGTSPAYQWQDSTAIHNWLDITGASTDTLRYTPAATGNKVRVKVTSNAFCVNSATVTSNFLSFTVNSPTAINPVPAADYDIHLYPNPVTSSLIIDTLALSDQWQSLEIRNIKGQQVWVQNIQYQTKIIVGAGQLSKGIYIVVLHKKNGAAVYLKFIKM